jgi:competence ComEA-like helix-hairpin-helix protein
MSTEVETSLVILPTNGLNVIRRYLIVHGFALLAAFSVTVLPQAVAGPSANWVTLEDCRYVPNPGNDGDSFHVRVKDKEYIFRLYFVDAPEMDAASPARLIDQAKYFGISVPQVIEVGEAAKSFVREKLAEPFAVRTHMAKAAGRSKLERLYVLVPLKDGDLGEQLVENGLARVHGTGAKPPELSTSDTEWQRLLQLESEAKQQKIGGWGANFGRLNLPTEKPYKKDAPNIPPSAPTPLPSNPSNTFSGEKLDINTASPDELQNIPGIGPVMAQRIIAARPFKSADDLRNVKGIGSGAISAKIRPHLN